VTARSRAIALLGLSALFAGIAASLVHGYERDVRDEVGPPVPVLVANKRIPRDKLLTPENAGTFVTETRVPAHFAPPHSLRFVRDAMGLRALSPVSPGSYLDEASLGAVPDSRRPTPAQSSSARLVEVPVAGAGALAEGVGPGSSVDVLITSDNGSGPPRTYVALEGVRLVDFRGGGSVSDSGGRDARAAATLRVTLREAVLLTAAQNFARELRLVARPPGDDARAGPISISARQLHP
jgi:pilus assembly protein CpaB